MLHFLCRVISALPVNNILHAMLRTTSNIIFMVNDKTSLPFLNSIVILVSAVIMDLLFTLEIIHSFIHAYIISLVICNLFSRIPTHKGMLVRNLSSILDYALTAKRSTNNIEAIYIFMKCSKFIVDTKKFMMDQINQTMSSFLRIVLRIQDLFQSIIPMNKKEEKFDDEK